jgi:hypothetical protein
VRAIDLHRQVDASAAVVWTQPIEGRQLDGTGRRRRGRARTGEPARRPEPQPKKIVIRHSSSAAADDDDDRLEYEAAFRAVGGDTARYDDPRRRGPAA